MVGGPGNAKELGFYVALAQVGLEMVVPIVIGSYVFDHYLGWTPWGATVCAVLGLVLGLAHLLTLLNRREKSQSESQESP